MCEFREKVRQYCINKFVRTTLLSKNIILFENNTYILVKKFGRRTLRESNDSVKQYIYTIIHAVQSDFLWKFANMLIP